MGLTSEGRVFIVPGESCNLHRQCGLRPREVKCLPSFSVSHKSRPAREVQNCLLFCCAAPGRKDLLRSNKGTMQNIGIGLEKMNNIKGGEVDHASLINACRSISQALAFPNEKRTYWVFNRREVKSYFLKMLLESQSMSSQAGSVTPSSMSKLKEQNQWWKQKTVIYSVWPHRKTKRSSKCHLTPQIPLQELRSLCS